LEGPDINGQTNLELILEK